MKKYKVLTDLFKGFEINDIIYLAGNNVQYAKDIDLIGGRALPSTLVESYPEYFEEVIEPKYDKIIEKVYDCLQNELEKLPNDIERQKYFYCYKRNEKFFSLGRKQD